MRKSADKKEDDSTVPGVSKTAYYVAVWKSDGQNNVAKRPVYAKDPYIGLFFDSSIEREAKAKLEPKSYRAVQIRHKHIRRELRQSVQKSDKTLQVIFLGSGFETIPLLKKTKWMTKYSVDVTFYEIDLPNIIDVKGKVLSQNNVQLASTLIGCDYTQPQSIVSLSQYGVCFDEPTHIIWEGNTYYLTGAKIQQVLSDLNRVFSKQIKITFDYFSSKVINHDTGSEAMNLIQDEFSSMGAQFKTGYDDIESLVEPLGYTVLSDSTIPELDKQYFQEDAPVPEIEDHEHSVCTILKK